MSLSWTESLRVSLSPDRVGLIRMSRGWQRMLAEKVVASAPPDAAVPSWTTALAAFETALGEAARSDVRVTVVLSNHFVRYLLVPWNASLAGEAETTAHARHLFSRVYGAVADTWDIRLSEGKGSLQVACAVDHDLLARLDQIVAASGKHLVSVQPYLMAAFNRWRKEFDGPLVWFILTERGRLCLAAMQNGHWMQLVNLQSDAGLIRKLPGMLARQRIIGGLDHDPGKVYVAAHDEETERILQRSGESVRSLHSAPRLNLPPDEVASLEMALNG